MRNTILIVLNVVGIFLSSLKKRSYSKKNYMNTISIFLKYLANVKIGTKLLGSFVLILSLTVSTGLFSIFQMAKVNQVSTELALRWMPSISHTTAMRREMLLVRALEVKHANVADVGYMEEYEDKIANALKLVEREEIEYLKVNGTNGEVKELYISYKRNYDEYLKFSKIVLSLSRANNQNDAKEVSEGAAKLAMDDTIFALDKLTEFSFEGGKDAAEYGNNIYSKAKCFTMILLGVSIFIGVILAISLTRSLLQQLGGEPSYATLLANKLADGKLYIDIALKEGDSKSLLAGIRNMRNGIAMTVKEVRSRADDIAVASNETDQRNKNLAIRTEKQALTLERTTASMEELSATVRRNADNAEQANQLAIFATTVAVNGGKVVHKVVETMKGINDSSRKISDIISVIDEIAFQTNILALNAAVEAARAGEQGRGFAVVASEVRNLASRSAQAAKEIKSLICSSVERVDQGTALVNHAGETMTEVVNSISRVTHLIGEISTDSKNQSLGVAQVSAAVIQIDQGTQQNGALVQEMAAAASSLSQQARELVKVVSIFVLNKRDDNLRVLV